MLNLSIVKIMTMGWSKTCKLSKTGMQDKQETRLEVNLETLKGRSKGNLKSAALNEKLIAVTVNNNNQIKLVC